MLRHLGGLGNHLRARRRRFRHAVNAMAKAMVEDATQLGVSKMILGGIRDNNNHDGKVNLMMHNFRSFRWITQIFREKSMEIGR